MCAMAGLGARWELQARRARVINIIITITEHSVSAEMFTCYMTSDNTSKILNIESLFFIISSQLYLTYQVSKG